jgi:hypothetical protein
LIFCKSNKNIIKEADAKGGPFPPHSTKNNMEGFDLPMGLFASKNVVDISGKESTYKIQAAISALEIALPGNLTARLASSVASSGQEGYNSANLSNTRGCWKGDNPRPPPITTKARDGSQSA